MATATTRRKKGLPDGGTDPALDGIPGPAPRRGRWKWLLGGVVLLGLALWLSPAIVANTPLLGLVVNWAAADLNGTVTVDGASLGWFSKPTIVGITARDEDDQPLLEIPSISGSRSLVDMLRDSSNLGSIRVKNPKISIAIDEQGSTNFQRALADFLATDGEPLGPIYLELVIVDGQVLIADARSGQSWQVDKFQLDMLLPAATSLPISLETSGEIVEADSPGSFSSTVKLSQTAADSTPPAVSETARDELTLKTQNLSLAVLQPVLGRFSPQTQLSGRLSSTVKCRFDRNTLPELFDADIDVTAEDFFLATPQLQSDRVQLKQLRAVGQIARREGQLHIGELVLTSDIADLSLAGTFDLGGKPMGQSLSPLLQQDYQCRGTVDLAKLAAILPATLQIRDNTQVTSGEVDLNFSSSHRGAGRTWTARLEAGKLEAVNRGRNISWQQPVVVTLHAATGPAGPVIKSLRCESDFLQAVGAGTLNEFTLGAQFDLGRLTAQLDSLVDLGPYRPTGKGNVRFDWHRTHEQQFRTQGEVELSDFRITDARGRELAEDRLTLSVSANGQTNFTAQTSVDRASLEITADLDSLLMQLVEPIDNLQGGGTWPLAVELKGDLARWQTRLEPWFPNRDWTLAGTCDLSTKLTLSTDVINVEQLDVSAQQLRVRGPTLDFHETSADLAVSGGRWSNQATRLEVGSAQWTAPSLSARADNLVVDLNGENPLELAGNLTYQGDADRIQQWLTVDRTRPAEWAIYGRFSGRAGITPSAGTTSIESVTTVRNLVAAHRSGYRHREDDLSVTVNGKYDPKTGAVDLTQAKVSSTLIGGNLAGRLATVNGRSDLQLAGQIDYDLDRISQLLPVYLGPGLQLRGRDSAKVSYRGPLSLDAAQANTDFRWASANLYGFQLGPGNLNAILTNNVLSLKSPELKLNEGSIWLNAQVRGLVSDSQAPGELYIPPGRVAQQIRITPQMCASGLQYVAPVLAGVTSAEGRFSIDLDGGRIPLGKPAEGELAGRMTVNSIEVGPGPLVRELALVLGYESPVEIARDSVVTFRMVEGRVYHRDLELVFPDLTVKTYGSVGIGPADRSLAMMAEMPIPPKLLGRHAALDSALRNQTIRLPIGGTLDKPRIDSRELERLTGRFIENAAGNLIQNELEKGLQSLFGTQE